MSTTRYLPYLIGIDEAGRGPLAGPVSVGVVSVPHDFDWTVVAGAKDSKQMTAKHREEIYALMCVLRREGKLDFAVAFSSAVIIDTRGIVPAVQSALDRALAKVVKAGALQGVDILLDGSLHASEAYRNQKTIIRGDQSEPVISLASIAAKVMRDRLMVRLAKDHPAYGFDIHKGYGTLAHRQAIKREGLSAIHRATFCTRVI